VWDEIAAARTDGRSVTDYLPELVGRLNDSGRELVLKAAILVAMADGRLGREEEAQLVEISKALEMSPERVQMIIAEMPALRSPPPPGF
jgi:tellurite resistance protein